MFFLTWWSNSEIDFYFLPEDLKYLGKEHTALIVNHRYDMDWLCSLILCDHFRTMRGIQAFIKDMLKFVPVVGWAWYFQDLIFLQRSFEKDQKTIQRALSNTFDDEQSISVSLKCFPLFRFSTYIYFSFYYSPKEQGSIAKNMRHPSSSPKKTIKSLISII